MQSLWWRQSFRTPQSHSSYAQCSKLLGMPFMSPQALGIFHLLLFELDKLTHRINVTGVGSNCAHFTLFRKKKDKQALPVPSHYKRAFPSERSTISISATKAAETTEQKGPLHCLIRRGPSMKTPPLPSDQNKSANSEILKGQPATDFYKHADMEPSTSRIT